MRIWDWITAGGLWVVAIIEAADAALKEAPDVSSHMPSFVGGGLWGFTPIALLLVVGVIWIWRTFLPTSSKKGRNAWWDKQLRKLERVENRKFTHEDVVLDGKSFQHCIFTDATLIYHGDKPYQWIECSMNGRMMVQTDHPGIKAFMEFTARLQSMPTTASFQFLTKNKNTGEINAIGDLQQRVPPPTQPPQTKGPPQNRRGGRGKRKT